MQDLTPTPDELLDTIARLQESLSAAHEAKRAAQQEIDAITEEIRQLSVQRAKALEAQVAQLRGGASA